MGKNLLDNIELKGVFLAQQQAHEKLLTGFQERNGTPFALARYRGVNIPTLTEVNAIQSIAVEKAGEQYDLVAMLSGGKMLMDVFDNLQEAQDAMEAIVFSKVLIEKASHDATNAQIDRLQGMAEKINAENPSIDISKFVKTN